MTPVGSTAQWIAAARAAETECANPIFSDPFARALAGEAGFALMATLRETLGAAPGSGPDAYLSIRTRYLDDQLLAAVRERGLTQVAMLAAGMDTRAFRLDWPQGVVLFEVDREDVFDHKEPILAQLGATARCDRRVVRADLAATWIEPLIAAGFDRTQPAAFLIEGLLMYLEPSAVDRLLDGVGSLARDGSWLGLDIVNVEMLDSPFTAPYMKKLAELGCGWKFGTSDPDRFFARLGWLGEVVAPGEPGAHYGRWLMPAVPRSLPGIPRTFFLSATKSDPVIEADAGPVSIESAEHYVWGQQCDGWRLLRSEGLTVIQERMPPGAAETRHRHKVARQFFYVLSGELQIEVEGVAHAVGASSGLEIRPGAAHQVINRGEAAAEFLVISQPTTDGDRHAASAPE